MGVSADPLTDAPTRRFAINQTLPLRTRLALGYTTFFAVVLALLGVGMYLMVRQALLSEIARQLSASADLIQQDFETSNADLSDYFNDPAFLLRTHPPRVEGLESPSFYVEIRANDGAPVVTSASLQEQNLPFDPATVVTTSPTPPQPTEALLGDRRILLLAQPLVADEKNVGILQVAQPLRETERTLDLLLLSLGATGLVALLAAARGGVWLAARSLRSVEEIAQTARQIVRAEDLARRVPQIAARDEISELTTTINDLLSRLEHLFNTQRRFVADVSHELRTPLAAMRGHIEILQRGAKSRRPPRIAH